MLRLLEQIGIFTRDELARGGALGLEWQAGLPRWLVFGLGLALIGCLVRAYAADVRAARRRLAPALLRAGALAGALIIACKPALVLQREQVQRATVALVLDTSASMSLPMDPALAEGGANRLETVTQALRSAEHAALRALLANNDLRIFGAGDILTALAQFRAKDDLPSVSAALPALAPTGPASRLAATLVGLLSEQTTQQPAAIILVSDGQDQSRDQAARLIELARSRDIPIHVVPVGSPLAQPDLAVGPLQLAGGVYAGDLLAVRTTLQAAGIEGAHTISVSLIDDERNETLSSTQVTVDAATSTIPVELFALPARAGALPLRVEAQVLPGEHNVANNLVRGAAEVIDEHLRVLYVEGYPRYEYRYLKNALLREPTVRLSCLLLSADEGFAQEGSDPIRRFPETTEELAGFEVIILGDVDPHGYWISPPQLQLLSDFVAGGGGLAVIAGQRHAPSDFRGTLLESLLPVRIAAADTPSATASTSDGFYSRRTPAGSDAPILRWRPDAAENRDLFEALPPLYWLCTTAGPRPGAEVLLEHPAHSAGEAPLPVVVTGRCGAGRTFFQATDDTWRWRRHQGELLHDSYWLRVVRALAPGRGSTAAPGIELAIDSSPAQLGERVRLRAHVRDALLLAKLPERLTLLLRDAAGFVRQEVTLPPVGTVQAALFAATFLPRETGDYTLSIAEVASESPLGQLRIDAPDLEMREPRADHAYLRDLAEATGGRVLPAHDLAAAFATIEDRSQRIPDDIRASLWDRPLTLGLLLALLAGEWILRRLMGLRLKMPLRDAKKSPDLLAQLTRLRATLRRRLMLYGVCAVAAGGVCALLAIVTLDWLLHLPAILRIGVGGLYALGCLLAIHYWIGKPLGAPLSIAQLAVHLDHHIPNLNDRLTSTVQFLSAGGDGSPAMRARMIANTRAIVGELPIAQTLTLRPLLRGATLALAGSVGMALVLTIQPTWIMLGVTRYLHPFAAAPWPTRVEIVELTGDTAVAVGDPFTVALRVVRGDSRRLRPVVYLGDTDGETSYALRRQADGDYTYQLENLTANTRVWFQAGDANTRDRVRTLRVVRPPIVTRALAHAMPPEYAPAGPERTFDLHAGAVRAIAGARVTFELTTSKPVAVRAGVPSAALHFGDETVPLQVSPAGDGRLGATITCTQTVDVTAQIVDEDGFTNRDPASWRVEVSADQPPTVALRQPAGPLELTPEAELRVEADAADDLGIARLELRVGRRNTADEQTYPLTPAAGDEGAIGVAHPFRGGGAMIESARVRASGRWRMSDLGAAPGEVLTLRAEAADVFPDAIGGQRAASPPIQAVIIDAAALQRRERQRVQLIAQQVRQRALALEELADLAAQPANADKGARRNVTHGHSQNIAHLRDLTEQTRDAIERLDANSVGDAPVRVQARALAEGISAALTGPLLRAESLLADLASAVDGPTLQEIAELQRAGAAQLHQALRQLEEWDDFASTLEQIRALLDRQQIVRRDSEAGNETAAAVDAASQERIARAQRLLAEDTEHLIATVRAALAGGGIPAEHADSLDAAVRAAGASEVVRYMFDAARALAEQRGGVARIAQRAAESGLTEMLGALAAERSRQLIDLARTLTDAGAAVKQLRDDVQKVYGDTQLAAQNPEPSTALDSLGDRAYTLAGNSHHLADTWRSDDPLNRFAAQLDDVHAALQSAAGALFDRNSQTGLEHQQTALDSLTKLLDACQQDAARAQRDAERQRTAQVHSRLLALIARQTDLNTATAELITAVNAERAPSRLHTRKAAALATDQEKLREETMVLRDELADVVLYQFTLNRTTERMQAAQQALTERRLEDELSALQTSIVHELTLLARALSDLRDLPEPDSYARRDQRGDAAAQPSADGPPVPPLAELLVVKALQEEINSRTLELAQQAVVDAPTEAQLRAARDIAGQQQELRELTSQLVEKVAQRGS